MDKETVIDLIKDAGYGFLATVEGKQPRVRPMMPYLTEEGELLLAILSHSRTIIQVRENPQVEMCYVDRKMAFCRITGKAKISDNIEQKELVWSNIPMLRQFFSGPQDSKFVLIVIDPGTLEAMTPTQQTPTVLTLK